MSPASSDWVHTFEIPEKFSVATTAAVRKGQLTKNGRTDLVAAMHTRMLQFQMYPTPYEYRTACMRLV